LTPNNNNLPHSTTASLLQHQYYPNHHYQQQRKEHVRIEQTTKSLKTNLTNTNNTNNLLTLTGRHLQSNSPYNTKLVNTKHQNHNVSLILISYFI